MQIPENEKRTFQIVCVNCDGIGITFECPETAPVQTIIRCRLCGAPRGTLGQLRRLALSEKLDLFEL